MAFATVMLSVLPREHFYCWPVRVFSYRSGVRRMSKPNLFRSLRTVLCTLALVAVSACGGGGGGTAAPPPPSTPAPLSTPIVAGLALPPAGTIYVGGYINTSGLPHAYGPSITASFETQIGRKLAIDLVYHDFITKFPGRGGLDDYANGRIPLYSWNCGISNAQVAAGAADTTLRLQASAIAAYGWPIFVRYMWDMNLTSAYLSRASCFDGRTDGPNNFFSPTEYIAAWNHIRQIFREAGAVNAVWVWTISPAGTNAQQYYPGDSQVDWVGMDSYDLTNGSFGATIAPMYGVLAAYNKPIMISETGASATNQTAFFSEAAPALQTQFPAVKAFVYYDAIGAQDWRITPASLSAFSAFANVPYTKGMYVAP